MQKKLKGDPLGFFNIHSIAKLRKMEWGNLLVEKYFSEKSRTMPEETERRPLVAPGNVCYAE